MDTILGIDLPTWWFLLIGALISGYGILDGFDLVAGAVHLFFRKEESRRIALNAIGPVWDGNEVWLVIGAGALFAAFPLVYGTILSVLYLPFILFLVAIIFRAISIEFRGKEDMKWWRKLWDVSFCASSIVISLLLGLILGNLIQGLPLNANHEFVGRLRDFFNPYALLVAVTVLALFMMHGSMYLIMKTEDRIFTRLTIIANNTSKFFILCFVATSMATLIYVPHMTAIFKQHPALFGIAIAAVLIVLNIRRSIEKRQYQRGFISSSITTALLLILFAMGLYPNLVLSNVDPRGHISIYEAASSDASLRTMLLFAVIGMPLVATYTVFMFWTFRGKVKIEDHSY